MPAERLLVNGTADNVLRLLPPLNLTREEADAGLAIIERALRHAAANNDRASIARPRSTSAARNASRRDQARLSRSRLAQRRRARRAARARRRGSRPNSKIGLEHPYLRGKTLAMIFQKPSLRTRITFETGMAQLGGHAIYLAPQDIGIGERESVKDVARNLSRWVDLIMIRTFAHETCVELAREATRAGDQRAHRLAASVPVAGRPADAARALRRICSKLRVAFVGDGFNLAQSWIEAAALARLRAAPRVPARLRAASKSFVAAAAQREGRHPHRTIRSRR